MNTTPTVNDLLLLARITRRRAHDREADLAELRDRAEETGATAEYHAERDDALEATADDLWALIDGIEQVKEALMSSESTSASGSGSGRRGPSPAARRARARDQRQADKRRGLPRERVAAGIEEERDEGGSSLERDAVYIRAPRLVADAVDRALPAVSAGGAPQTMRSTVAVRVRRDSDQFRAMLDPRGGQTTVLSGSRCRGFMVATLELALLAIACDQDELPFVCVAVPDAGRADVARVLSGWVRDVVDADDGPTIVFEDGTAVLFAATLGYRLG